LRTSTRILLEVGLVFIAVIGVCRLLYEFRSIPFISQTLPLWAAVLFLYLPLIFLYLTKTKPELWGITLNNWSLGLKATVIISILTLPSFVVVYRFYQQWWLHISSPAGLSFTTGWAMLLLYHLLCVAFPEEVFYRGYMQSRLNQIFPKRFRFFGAPLGISVLLTTILFALGHFIVQETWNSLATFVPGLVFGWLRERTGSILASTLYHALCNGTILLLN